MGINNTLGQTFQSIADAIREKGVVGSMSPNEMANKIKAIPVGEVPKGVAVDGVKWTSEWQTKGQNGTIIDVVVGDQISYRREIAVSVGKASGTIQVTIDWGDGTTTTTTGTSNAVTTHPHTYSQPGHYVVTVDNNAASIQFGSSSYSTTVPTANTVGSNNNRNAIRRVRQFGSSLKTINHIFANCIYLNSEAGGYPDELPPLPPTINSMNYAFYNCLNYAGHIPYVNHLSSCTTMGYTFNYMRDAIGTAQIFPPKITSAIYTYQGCSHLSSVPYDIFPDSLSSTLTNASYCFESFGCYSQNIASSIQFPKISHLTKLATTAYMFQSCRLFTGDLPELPAGAQLTSIVNMFYNLYSPLTIHQDYLSRCTNLKSINSTFYGCYELTGECPSLPSTLTSNGLNAAFYGCNLLGGGFPTIPSNYVGGLSGTFYNCYSISGQMPDIPAGVNDLRSTFYNCGSATGKFPDLGGITNLAAATYATSTFYGCRFVSRPPATWFNSTICAKLTSTSSMFAYCSALESFPFDLDSLTATTVDCQQMFRDCFLLKTGPKKLPANVTSTSYMFTNCYSLDDSPIHIGTYAKLTNISYMYQYCHSLKPMVDSDGNLEMDKAQYYKAFTTVTSAVQYSSMDVQKQFYDACVASGQTGTKLGSTSVNIQFCYYYTGGIA